MTFPVPPHAVGPPDSSSLSSVTGTRQARPWLGLCSSNPGLPQFCSKTPLVAPEKLPLSSLSSAKPQPSTERQDVLAPEPLVPSPGRWHSLFCCDATAAMAFPSTRQTHRQKTPGTEQGSRVTTLDSQTCLWGFWVSVFFRLMLEGTARHGQVMYLGPVDPLPPSSALTSATPASAQQRGYSGSCLLTASCII